MTVTMVRPHGGYPYAARRTVHARRVTHLAFSAPPGPATTQGRKTPSPGRVARPAVVGSFGRGGLPIAVMGLVLW
jgi:hypothetical protein